MCKQNNIKKHQGFTLVELLVTMAILAVLATVSVVGYTSYIERSAVSADNYFVTQLNGLTRLYEIDHTNNFEESDVRKLLKDAGITSLELKSESYDYQLYFNQNNNKFILTTEDYSNDEKYLLIDDGFLSKSNGDDVVGDNENKEENNPGEVTPPAGGDQEPEQGEPTVPDTPEVIEPNLVLQDFEVTDLGHNRYVKAENGVINVGVNISEEEQLKTTFYFSNIEIIDINTNIVWNVVNYIMEGKEITKTKYEFTEVGEKTLTVTVTFDDMIKTIDIPIKIWNVNLTDAKITIPKQVQHSIDYIHTENNMYSVTLSINDFLSLVIIETNPSTSGTDSRSISDNPSFLNNMEILVSINSSAMGTQQIDLEYQNSIVVNFENVEITGDKIECTIIYRYQGINGNWCETSKTITQNL